MRKTLLIFVLFNCLALISRGQNPNWKYIRSSNTGIGGDYQQAIRVDRFNNKWTGGYMPFWSEGSVSRFNDTAWTCWSNFEGYLPADRVYDIAFDQNDGLWVATNGVGNGVAHGGIAHYDGTTWTQYTTLNTPMPTDDMRGICVDGNNVVWATFYNVNGGGGGIAKFDGTMWTIYTPSNSNLQTAEVDKIMADAQNNIWIGTNMGLVKFDGLNWILNLTGSNVTDVEYDATTNKIYAATGGAINIYDGTNWTQINSTNSPVSATGLWAVDAKGDSIIITTVGGSYLTYIYDGINWITHPETDHTYDARIDNEGNFWICGIGRLEKFDGTNWTRYTRYNTGLTTYFLGDKLFVDSKNRKWFSTNDNGGMSMFDCPVWEDYGLWNDGLWPMPLTSGINGSSATEDIFGNIWMSYYSGGIVKIPNGDVHNPGAWVTFPSSSFTNVTCTLIAADSSGDVWAEGGCGLAVQYNHNTGNWVYHNLYNMGLPCGSNNYMYSIKTNPNDSTVWFCTQAGIAIYDAGSWTIKSQLNGTLPFQGSYYDVVFDSQNNAWIASDDGLIKMTGSTWTIFNQANSSLIADHINSLVIDSNDVMYLVSYSYLPPYYGGMNVFDGVNNWQTFNAYSSPIVHHQINCITLDKLGNVWMTTLPYGAIIYNPNGVQGFECIDQSLQSGGTTGIAQNNSSSENSIVAFPNPFHSSTTLEFNLSETINVSIVILDVVGREVLRIPAKELQSGINRIFVNLETLNNGLYLCQIKSNEKLQSIKLIKN